MGKEGKQALRKDTSSRRKKELLLSMGQPIIKVHKDKYSDKAEESRIRISTLDGPSLLEEIHSRNGNNKGIEGRIRADKPTTDKEQNEFQIYRSRIYGLLDSIYDSIKSRNYKSCGKYLSYKGGLLERRELFSMLAIEEQTRIRDSFQMFEDAYTASQFPSLNEDTSYSGKTKKVALRIDEIEEAWIRFKKIRPDQE